MSDVQEKRDGLDLTMLFQGGIPEGQAVVRTIEGLLSEYLLKVLNPELSEAEALTARNKALALIDVAAMIGIKMSRVNEAAIRKVSKIQIQDNLHINSSGL